MSDISAREVQIAMCGPLQWPEDPHRRLLYYRMVLFRLRLAVGAERVRAALLIGKISDVPTETIRANARWNASQIAAGRGTSTRDLASAAPA